MVKPLDVFRVQGLEPVTQFRSATWAAGTQLSAWVGCWTQRSGDSYPWTSVSDADVRTCVWVTRPYHSCLSSSFIWKSNMGRGSEGVCVCVGEKDRNRGLPCAGFLSRRLRQPGLSHRLHLSVPLSGMGPSRYAVLRCLSYCFSRKTDLKQITWVQSFLSGSLTRGQGHSASLLVQRWRNRIMLSNWI